MIKPVDFSESRRNNNFDLLRLAGALLVLFSHSYGEMVQRPEEFIYRWTGHRYALSTFGLLIFFSISGYLVTGSLLHSTSVKQYIWKRFLRIYPGYIVITLLSVFVLGPVFTSLSLSHYFSEGLTWKFLYQNICLLNSPRKLPGVFEGKSVNLSVWTLPFELELYGLLLLLYLLKFFRYRWLQAVLFLIATCIKFFIPLHLLQQWFHFDFGTWYSLGYVFLAGSTLYTWRDKITLHYVGVIVLLVVWLITELFHCTNNATDTIFFVYTIIWIGLKTYIPLKWKPDISYGIYIYGSPVQRVISSLTQSSLPLWNYNLVVVPLTVVMGFLSWFLVEKKAMKFKNKVQ
jgi:peptidoglycan/LPS O-acetylase OafA/YrhL